MRRVLIVIPCLNEARHIGTLLGELKPYALASGAQIVVADGGSTDGTQQIVQDIAASAPHIHLLDNPKRIQSAAVNLAVERFGADADWLIRIDAHAKYPADYCQTLLAEAQTNDADSVVVSMHAQGHDSIIQKLAAATQNSPLGNGGSAHRMASSGRWVDHGHHALMKISAFRAVGDYDETFTHNEDAELDLRLTRAGYHIWLTGRTYMTYFPRGTLRALARQYYNYGKGRSRTLLKHQLRPKPRQRLMVGVAPALVLAFLCMVFWVCALPATIWFSACILGGIALALKERQPLLVLTGLVAALMHLSWSLGFWAEIIRKPALARKPVPA